MSSEIKTKNLELNQWQGNEYLKREDLNEDNKKIDDAMGKISKEIEGIEVTAEKTKLNNTNFKSDNVNGALDELFQCGVDTKDYLNEIFGYPSTTPIEEVKKSIRYDLGSIYSELWCRLSTGMSYQPMNLTNYAEWSKVNSYSPTWSDKFISRTLPVTYVKDINGWNKNAIVYGGGNDFHGILSPIKKSSKSSETTWMFFHPYSGHIEELAFHSSASIFKDYFYYDENTCFMNSETVISDGSIVEKGREITYIYAIRKQACDNDYVAILDIFYTSSALNRAVYHLESKNITFLNSTESFKEYLFKYNNSYVEKGTIHLFACSSKIIYKIEINTFTGNLVGRNHIEVNTSSDLQKAVLIPFQSFLGVYIGRNLISVKYDFSSYTNSDTNISIYNLNNRYIPRRTLLPSKNIRYFTPSSYNFISTVDDSRTMFYVRENAPNNILIMGIISSEDSVTAKKNVLNCVIGNSLFEIYGNNRNTNQTANEVTCKTMI